MATDATTQPSLDVEPAGELWRFTPVGDWTLDQAAHLDRLLKAELASLNDGSGDGNERPSRRAEIDLHEVEKLDTAGAWLLHRTERHLRASGVQVEIRDRDCAYSDLFTQVSKVCFEEDLPPATRRSLIVRWIEMTGARAVWIGNEAVDMLNFFGSVVSAIGQLFIRPGSLRLTALVHHLQQTGLNALGIVGLMSFLIGVVLAFQGASQLRLFGAELFTVNLLGVSVLREIGVLLTAIIVAGRSGSAFTAQIGSMKVNEEVDAIRTLGLDPIQLLVVPRVLALVIAMPLLAFFADVMALFGGCLMVIFALDIPFAQFMNQLEAAITVETVMLGLIKAPVFAFLIAMVGCRNGLRVSGNAESVGQLTTEAVVKSIFLVIVVDAVFSIVYNLLGF